MILASLTALETKNTETSGHIAGDTEGANCRRPQLFYNTLRGPVVVSRNDASLESSDHRRNIVADSDLRLRSSGWVSRSLRTVNFCVAADVIIKPL